MNTLAGIQVLLVDAQATAANPGRGALIEIGWAPWSADRAPFLPATEVTAHVVAAPPGTVLPAAVARLTGLKTAEWVRGIEPQQAWQRFLGAAGMVASPPGPTPAVIHFARFEAPFLRALHARHGTGPFPLDLFCTHAIARRLFPELPRCTLRALAGYLGASVPRLRRCADHVAATGFLWHHLAALLAEREGVADLADLRDWLVRPARRSPRRWPLPRERRRQLPDRPGVYRFLRTGGSVLYVGKATSLRQRVSSHLHARTGQSERTLEMLTQARDVSWCETATALEAALLETDEIKRLAPPYNVALGATGRAIWFTTAELDHLQERPDAEHTVGPLASPALIEPLQALRTALAGRGSVSLPVRSCAVGVEAGYAPEPECFIRGLSRFVAEHGHIGATRCWLRLGAWLWALRHAAKSVGAEPEIAAGARPDAAAGCEGVTEIRRSRAWDEERVAQALEETVLRAAHAVRRARWLSRLSECSLAWTERGTNGVRLLSIQGGSVAMRTDLEPGAPLPVPAGHARPFAERRAAFDLATFDRLRVLTTELRRLSAEAGFVELRFGPRARFSRRRAQAVLRWV